MRADVYEVDEPTPLPITVNAGMMTTNKESILIHNDVHLVRGEKVICTTNAQWVTELDCTVGVGRYLVVIEPDGQETYLVRPHVENLMGRSQHYIAAQLVGLFEAAQEGTHSFELRSYCGTVWLKRDGRINAVYRQMQIMTL